jgi:hypothetical protein
MVHTLRGCAVVLNYDEFNHTAGKRAGKAAGR